MHNKAEREVNLQRIRYYYDILKYETKTLGVLGEPSKEISPDEQWSEVQKVMSWERCMVLVDSLQSS
jgi:hypothetical protein